MYTYEYFTENVREIRNVRQCTNVGHISCTAILFDAIVHNHQTQPVTCVISKDPYYLATTGDFPSLHMVLECGKYRIPCPIIEDDSISPQKAFDLLVSKCVLSSKHSVILSMPASVKTDM